MFVGSYASAAERGIHMMEFDSSDGSLKELGGTSGIENPSFLCLDESGRRVYAVSETNEGAAVSYDFDSAQHTLSEINRQPTDGASPCFISLHEDGTWLTAVNYSSGSVVLYTVDGEGHIGELKQQIQHTGSSVNPRRQEGPHPHSIRGNERSPYLIVPDLGADCIYTYRKNTEGILLELQQETKTEPGVGPRHLAYHPHLSVVYVIEEMGSAITAYHYDQEVGTLKAFQHIGTLPADYEGENTAADIHIDPTASYLYGSNRGHDSIAAFRILGDGRLELIGHSSTMGKTPRNFAMSPDGAYLLAANQDSDSIAVMRIQENGMPIPTGTDVKIGAPVCLVFAASSHNNV